MIGHIHPALLNALRVAFQQKLEPHGDCLLWTGGANNLRGGYGYATFRKFDVLNVRAHRLAYALAHGPITQEQHILHSCDQPLCCNPAHLSLGSQQSNMAEAVDRQRIARGARHSQAKLQESDIHAIRADTRLQRLIAADYGVSVITISDIKRRRSWAHI